MVTDPIADFIVQLKNAGAVGKASVGIPYSNVTFAVAQLLKREGYVDEVSKRGKRGKKTIEVALRYDDDEPRITNVRRVSKPSRRVYWGVRDIRPVRQGHGLVVLSTPKGVASGADARKSGVGGEVLFELW
ncbi:30S ribosomal protein S8 [Candidatus Wolfebacteria bacterium]|nr:30S ribosomal protein S8 [Candidatus Wolfebacteria bacterium]